MSTQFVHGVRFEIGKINEKKKATSRANDADIDGIFGVDV